MKILHQLHKEFKLLEMTNKELDENFTNFKLRTRLNPGEYFYAIHENVLENFTDEKSIVSLFNTLSDERRKIFFIKI